MRAVNQATNSIGLDGLRPSGGGRRAQALAVRGQMPICTGMNRVFGLAPSTAEIETLALAALASLPEPFAAHLDGVVLQVEEFADAETLASVGLAEPFELTGIYEGVPVGDKHSAPSGTMPDRIRLFRSPILDEWIARGDETLEHLVAHVLIHEVGHHFGLSDADIEALENMA